MNLSLPRVSRLRDPDPTSLLVAASLGTYLLVLSGVSNALAGATATCSSWPFCHGPWLESPATAIVIGHRLAALLVGLILIATTISVLQHATVRVQWAVVAAAVLYPIQVVLGARAAVAGVSTTVGAVHLVTAMTIFTGLMAALIWQLEAQANPNRDRQESASSFRTPPTQEPAGRVIPPRNRHWSNGCGPMFG
ncbi:MAG: hypothetical protein U5K70_08660 [Halodesulfurarchaeum sp.]|nr:hypothetical protein [Halodesulfurarchaeum sp.]